MKKRKLINALGISLAVISGGAFGHSNFVENYDGSRTWKEGQRAFLKLNLAHTCGHGGVSEDIKNVKMVFPNGPDAAVTQWLDARGTSQEEIPTGLEGILYTYNKYNPGDLTAHRGANALMSIKPSVDIQFKTIEPTKEPVNPYYNHGENTYDVASIAYTGLTGAVRGKNWGLTNEYYANIEFVATLGDFVKESCYSKVVVDIPAADYGANGCAYVWTKKPTPGIPQELVASAGYAPSITIARDLVKNPLPDSCGGKGLTAEVAPSDAALDRYFWDVAEWVSKGKGGKSMKGLVDNHGCVAPEAWSEEMGHCMKPGAHGGGH